MHLVYVLRFVFTDERKSWDASLQLMPLGIQLWRRMMESSSERRSPQTSACISVELEDTSEHPTHARKAPEQCLPYLFGKPLIPTATACLDEMRTAIQVTFPFPGITCLLSTKKDAANRRERDVYPYSSACPRHTE